MRFLVSLLIAGILFVESIWAHYTFPSLIVNGKTTTQWANVRRTNAFGSGSPITDITSPEFRCHDTLTDSETFTVQVAAGSQLGIASDNTIYHPSVVNIYMAKAPPGTTAATFHGSGNVWFKVHEISAVTDGGTSITFPAQNLPSVSFTIPKNIPSGQYLVRIEAVALHVASTYAGAQFYISCGQIDIIGGGNGNPGPLVSIPGVYTGYEPGILININYPKPRNYTQPGPVSGLNPFDPNSANKTLKPVWRG